MTTIYYDPSRTGLGDCIVGCASAYILSIVLKSKFKVLNGKIKFYEYFDIPEIYKCESKIDYDKIINYEHDNKEQNDLFLSDLSSLFSFNNVLITSSQNFYQHLFQNKNFNITGEEYKVINELFSKILIPKKEIYEVYEYYKSAYNFDNSLCVHIRCENKWNDSNTDEKRWKINETVNRFIECITMLKNKNKFDNVILITDNPERIRPLFNNINYVIISGHISHSLNSDIVDYEKTLVDLLTIGSCKENIISLWSNFSRIGCLRTLKSPYIIEPVETGTYSTPFYFNIDNIGGYRKAELSELLSKEKILINDNVFHHLFNVYSYGFGSYFLRVVNFLALVHYNNKGNNYRIYASIHQDNPDECHINEIPQSYNLYPNSKEKENLWEYFLDPVMKYPDNISDIAKQKGNKEHWITEYYHNLKDKIGLKPHIDYMPEFDNCDFWCNHEVYKHPRFNDLRQRYSFIINKYINYKNVINNEMNKIMKIKGNDKWLGIHLRTPQHHFVKSEDINIVNDYYNGVVNSIIPIIDENKVDKIFIATESMEFISLMIKKYKNKLIYLNIPRGTGNFDWIHKTKKSFQVSLRTDLRNTILDILTLSKCDFLLGGVSNMFMSSLLINPNVQFKLIPYLENVRGA
jgi:hypothetical protein